MYFDAIVAALTKLQTATAVEGVTR